MKSLEKVQNPSSVPAIFGQIAGWINKAINAALNGVFSLTHQASLTRARALNVGFILALVASIWLSVPPAAISAAFWEFLRALMGGGETTPQLSNSFMRLLFVTVLHPAVVRHMLALIAPYWLLHRIAAIYLADVFEKDETVARTFVMQAAFGQAYNTIHIRQGKLADEDKDSTIIQIGGPGYIDVDLDSAVLFERPDGTPHVIGPVKKEVVDDFERLRRVVDLRDSIDQTDLAPTRSRDGIVVGAKDIQFSYSIFRGEGAKKTLEMPYPFDQKSIENLVYKDSRTVKPGIAPARAPEWQSGPFKMGGPVMGEIGSVISKRGLSEFLSNIGEPEEKSSAERDQRIDQQSQQLSDRSENQPGAPASKPPEFFYRTALTSQFYSQDGFLKRMAEKGFQLNWIGVGTWHTPVENIPSNHREAWKTSRENFARGNPQAIKAVRDEAKLRELLRMIQTMPIHKFYSDLEKADDEKLVDEMLREYDEILQRAAEGYLKGSNALDRRFMQLTQAAIPLYGKISRPANSAYEDFLRKLGLVAGMANFVFDYRFEDLIRLAPDFYNALKAVLDSEDKDFLQDASALYTDIKVYNQIRRAIAAIKQARTPHHEP